MGKSSDSRRQAEANTSAAQIQADASIRTSQIQADAADRAAQLGLQGAGIVAGASLGAASLSAGATREAATLQRESAVDSLAETQRQFDATTEDLQAYRDLGHQFLPEIERAATVEGFAERLSEIMDTDIFSDLQTERFRAADNRLGAAGLNRSGAAARSASDITADLALAVDSNLYGRQMNNVGIGQAASARQANLGQNFANSVTSINMGSAANIGNILTSGAATQGGFLVQGAQAQAAGLNAVGQGIQNSAFHMGSGIMGAANAQAGGLIGSANALAQGGQNRRDGYIAAGTAILGAVAMFSDERLKENMTPVGKVQDLTLYEWDWREDAKEMVGTDMSLGFSAQEVERKYPDCVVTTKSGFKAIHYDKLQFILSEQIENERLAA